MTARDSGIDHEKLRKLLTRVAARGDTCTYQQVAQSLALEPPNTIHRVAMALEFLMEQDVESRRPLLAAVVVSRTREGLPAPGFFARAGALGRYGGPERGPEAAAFHAAELAAVFEWWGTTNEHE